MAVEKTDSVDDFVLLDGEQRLTRYCLLEGAGFDPSSAHDDYRPRWLREPITTLPPASARECTMGSVNHPKIYDDATMTTVKAAFHDVWATVAAHDPFRDTAGDDDLKATIIRKLIDLVSEGKTSQDELRSEALRQLPLI